MRRHNETARLARTACLPCRRGKRRCDKSLPSCGLCIRREADCSYPGHNRNQEQVVGFHSEFPHPSSQLTLSKDTQYKLNAVCFISPQLHLQAQLELPRPSVPIPSNLSSLIGEASSISSIASFFFATIHSWLPIVSKRVFYNCLLNPLAARRTELSLLTLAMKLCCTAPAEEKGEGAVKTSLYHAIKRLHYEVESAGLLSIHVLQAGILIALYELGHAIYPAAYLTVGACTRYGLALGVNRFILASAPVGSGPISWNDIEERRRVWWAVIMFDRFLGLHDPARPLSTEDPMFDSHLPVDDTAWDNCTAKPEDITLMSTGFTLRMGPFARLAQATFLLSQALQSMKPKSTEDESARSEKMAQLRRTFLALVHTADAEATVRKLEFCAQSGLSLRLAVLPPSHQRSKFRKHLICLQHHLTTSRSPFKHR
ncbi:putative fungal-specific transcription factor [Xylogone sp. PMI_703]|nr:putative fungal-specific transcription factor [Xylogone sp. PMI_703]